MKDMTEEKEWKLIGHSSQIADTGDYDGHYEITNGKISLITNDDDEEALLPIVDAFNNSGCKFYQDDWAEFENRMLKEELRLLQNTTEGINIQSEVAKIHHQYGTSEMANYRIEQLFEKYTWTVKEETLKKAKEFAEKRWENSMGEFSTTDFMEGVKWYEEHLTVKDPLTVAERETVRKSRTVNHIPFSLTVEEVKNEGIKYLQQKYPDNEILQLPNILDGGEFIDFAMGLQVGHELCKAQAVAERELPGIDEIEKECEKYGYGYVSKTLFIQGAKWMRGLIKERTK